MASKLQHIKDASLTQFTKYIEGLPIHSNYKKAICNSDFVKANPDIYLFYPKLFAGPFGIAEQKLNKLCIAGYLYYQSSLLLDGLIDENDKSNIVLFTVCQEESVKLLTSIFGRRSAFWELWNQRRAEYFNAIYLEKELHGKEKVSFSEYEKLADYKVAFGKAAIDAVYTLGHSGETIREAYNVLLRSHAFFSVARQLHDDVLDFQKDLEANQFNWAVRYMQGDPDYEKLEAGQLNKLLYIRGHAKRMFKIAIGYLNKAEEEADHLHVPLWLSHIDMFRQQFVHSITEMNNYLEMLNAEASGSNKRMQKNTLDKSIQKSIRYVKKQQQGEGSWREYMNQAGISDVWSTAYITGKLSANACLKDEFKWPLKRALSFLQRCQTKNELWGYNTTWIDDADTTNFVLLSFLHNGISVKEDLLNRWAAFQLASGAFTTYANKELLMQSLGDMENVDGWMFEHQCVSAVALYYLAQNPRNEKILEQTKHFFNAIKVQKTLAYWWTDPIYTWYYLALSYHEMNDLKHVEKIQKEVVGRITSEGFYRDDYGANLFYTGLALEILLLNGNHFSETAKQCVSCLLKQQYNDGSWANSHALRIPHPGDKFPGHTQMPVATHGTQVRAKEINRLFTTVSTLKALCAWRDQR